MKLDKRQTDFELLPEADMNLRGTELEKGLSVINQVLGISLYVNIQ